MRRLAASVCAALLVIGACSSDDGSTQTAGSPSTSTAPISELTEDQFDSCVSALVDTLQRTSWFTAESFTVVTGPDETLTGVTTEGAEWVSGAPVLEDGDVLVVGMGADEFEAAVEADAVFAVGSPVLVVPMAAQVIDDRLVLFDPPCAAGGAFLDAAADALGVDADGLLALLMTDDGRQRIADSRDR